MRITEIITEAPQTPGLMYKLGRGILGVAGALGHEPSQQALQQANQLQRQTAATQLTPAERAASRKEKELRAVAAQAAAAQREEVRKKQQKEQAALSAIMDRFKTFALKKRQPVNYNQIVKTVSATGMYPLYSTQAGAAASEIQHAAERIAKALEAGSPTVGVTNWSTRPV